MGKKYNDAILLLVLPDRKQLNVHRRRLGFRLEEARKAKGMTLKQAGKLLGRSHTWVWKVEAAERRLDAAELWLICEAYGLDLKELIEEVMDA